MSSPSNGLNRAKPNITVASLINCNNVSRNPLLNPAGKSMKNEINLANNVSKIISTNITTIQNSHNLPTVANSDLLYKSVSSPNSNSTPPPLTTTSPVTTTLTVNYTLKPYTNIIGTLEQTSTQSPLNHIKTLTNVVTNPIVSKIDGAQSHGNNSLPSPNISTNILVQTPHATADSGLVNLLTQNVTKTTSLPICTNGNLISNHIIRNSTLSLNKDILNNVVTTKTTISPLKLNGQVLPAVFVPRGWNRIVEKDYITYISPNKSRLRSIEALIDYLQLEGTCKCGLECPFKPSEVFNFNPDVPSKFGFSASGKVDPDREISCNVCRKFEEMFPPAPKSKQNSRGRKSGVRKRGSSSDETKPSPERKKILLTGASPLEMFQTKMNAINASSSQFSKNFGKPTSKIGQNNILYTPSNIIGLNMSASTSEKFSKAIPVSQSLVATTTSMLPTNSFVTVPVTTTNTTITSPISTSNILSRSVSPGIFFNKQQQIKTSTKGRGRGRGSGRKSLSPKDSIQAKNFSNVLSCDPIQQQELLNQIAQQEVMATKQVLLSQLQNLLTTTTSPQELNEISLKALQFLTSSSTIPTSHQVNQIAPSLSVPPPNRTVSSINQLPDGLKTQMNIRSYLDSTTCATTTTGQPDNVCGTLSKNIVMTSMVPVCTVQANTQKSASKVSPKLISITSNQQQVNTPLHTLPLSQSQLPNHTVNTTGAQQMLLLQLVSQANANPTSTNAPVVCAISVAPQGYVQSQQPKFVFMDNKNCSSVPAIQTLTVQKNSTGEVITASSPENSNRTVQIKGLMSIQGQSQLSPGEVTHAVPLQYVTAVNPPRFTIQSPAAIDNSGYPVVQYISQAHTGVPVSYVYPALNKNAVVRPGHSATAVVPTSFVRIAPATQSSKQSTITSPLEQEKQKQEHELLVSMQEHLVEKNVSKRKVYDSLPAALEFLSGVANNISPTTSSIAQSSLQHTTDTITPPLSLPNDQSLMINNESLTTSLPSTTTENNVNTISPLLSTHNDMLSPLKSDIVNPHDIIMSIPLDTITDTNATTTDKEILPEDKPSKEDNHDELFLQCNESSSALMPDNEEITGHQCETSDEGLYSIGDVVWVQLPSHPAAWPAQVLSNDTMDEPKLDERHICVKMFYTKQVHSVSSSQLKPFERPSHTNVSETIGGDLEKAIAEAVQEVPEKMVIQ